MHCQQPSRIREAGLRQAIHRFSRNRPRFLLSLHEACLKRLSRDEYQSRRPCHRNSLRRAQKALQRALRLGMVLTMPPTTKTETQTANKADGERRPGRSVRDRFAARLWTGFWTERVTFRRPQIIREGRENTASAGPAPLQKGRSQTCGTRPGSWPAGGQSAPCVDGSFQPPPPP